MSESEILPVIAVFFAGIATGTLATLLFNKLRTGSASAGAIKKEKEAYQAEVEAHFEATSKKFKNMAAQYQDLCQHLSVGATILCRPENVAPGLTDQRNPLEVPESVKSVAKQKVVSPESKIEKTKVKAKVEGNTKARPQPKDPKT